VPASWTEEEPKAFSEVGRGSKAVLNIALGHLWVCLEMHWLCCPDFPCSDSHAAPGSGRDLETCDWRGSDSP
jgi:hypothetical protein